MLPLVCCVTFCLFSFPPYVYIASEHYRTGTFHPLVILDFWNSLARSHSAKSLAIAPALWWGMWEKGHFWCLLSPFSHCTGVSCSHLAALPSRPASGSRAVSQRIGLGHQRWDYPSSSTAPQCMQPLHPVPHAQGTDHKWHLPPKCLRVWNGGLSRTRNISQGCPGLAASSSPWEGGGRCGHCLLLVPSPLLGSTSEGWVVTPRTPSALFWCFTKLHCIAYLNNKFAN